ncbi:MAG TPA: DNA translocase FtsK [Afipia sp.]|uniref:DNA translocase FtsK n=1 Tax=unclassified Afipia TaxID=2642050 RepID=UPI0004654A51|nr:MULTISPECIES: DNA translocase FtsK 4TM domain-containing protein [unclassified Afipia]MAH70878.1 DNA translocase FtsK [Afipia sp.]OUX59996.1 MAG: DNA translocase FtsK [Afipia sp. TMED4]HAO42509.1 DNA translocase FtsK [Afipia sp.]HAP09891.1 DNA translocase FtsK [Afipia sp.]HAP49275.1 DNA translocase FtsK [Afipia sp.]
MPAIERVIPIVGQISDPLREMLARRLRELAGLGVIALSCVVAAALMTWSVQDPSLSHATSGPIRNLMGRPGAIGADMLMQILGLGAIMLILPVAIWGWRLVTHRHFDREALRIACWILCAVIAAGFASCLPRSGAWPLPTGLGGVVGDALVRFPAVVFGPPGLIYRIVLGVLLFAAMIGSFVFACGAGAQEKIVERTRPPMIEDEEDFEEDDRRSISLGWIVHTAMSAKTRVVRALSAFFAMLVGRTESRRSASFERMEPNLGGGRRAPSLVPQDEYEENEEEEEEEEEDEEPAPRARKRAEPKSSGRKGVFVLPPVSVLAAPKASDRLTLSKDELEENSRSLEGVLQDFGVRGEIVKASPGPVVTLYELEPAPGIKSSRVIGLADDIARSMSAISARVAVVSGRNAIGIELPNVKRETVYLRELLTAKEATGSTAKLPLCLGKTIGGEPVIVDLARMPHLLIAGTTGSGKSVGINTMILSLLYRLRPDQCRLIMVDPKMLELSVYDGIPHLLTPVVTDPKKAVVALKWAVREMEQRYKNMAKLGVRNIDGYNTRVAEAKAKGEELTRTVQTGFDKETGKAIYEEEKLELEPLPYIVIIVDEMADLMMVAGKDIEGAVQRLAQMARAAGLHVILATQRPSVDVITGTIKANFPTRISFQVTSKIDSRVLLGEMGAEQLLGQGDMLYMAGGGRISRVHGPFVSDEEVEKIVRHLKSQGQPEYLEAVTAEEETDEDGNAVFDGTSMGANGGEGDLFSQAVAIVKRDRKASTSYIQRRLQIGYNRAATLMERMELEGIVGQANHAGKREILVAEEDERFG